jgi:hypothetical protein
MTHDIILRNATEPELAQAVEENVIAMFRSMVYLGRELGFKDAGKRISRYLWRIA